MVPPAILSPTPPPQRMSWRQQHRARRVDGRYSRERRGTEKARHHHDDGHRVSQQGKQERESPNTGLRASRNVFPGFVFKSGFNYQLINGGRAADSHTKSQKKPRGCDEDSGNRIPGGDTLILESPASSWGDAADVCRECAPAVRRGGKVLSSAPCKMLPPEALRWPEHHCK